MPRPAPAPPPLASPRRPCGACAASSLRSSLPAPRLATLAAPRLVVARGLAPQRLFFHLPLIRWGLLRPRAPRLGGCSPSTPPRGSAPSTPHGAPAPCPPPGLFAPDPAKYSPTTLQLLSIYSLKSQREKSFAFGDLTFRLRRFFFLSIRGLRPFFVLHSTPFLLNYHKTWLQPRTGWSHKKLT